MTKYILISKRQQSALDWQNIDIQGIIGKFTGNGGNELSIVISPPFRKGFTAHTSAFSATDFPIRIDWNRESEGNAVCYKRAVCDAFGKTTGDNLPNLQNVTFGSDRGYLLKTLLEFLLLTGAHVIGTLQRSSWLPYTYGKPNQKGDDNPRNIEERKAKAGRISTFQWKAGGDRNKTRPISCSYYRSGSGTSVAISFSTGYHKPDWDAILANSTDHKWYFNQTLDTTVRKLKCFQLVHGGGNEDALKDLLDKVDPRTVSQRSQEWFIDRCFAATSSTSWFILDFFFSGLSPDHPIVQQLTTIATYAGRVITFETPEEEEEDVAQDVDDSSSSDESTNEANDEARDMLELSSVNLVEFKRRVPKLKGKFLRAQSQSISTTNTIFR